MTIPEGAIDAAYAAMDKHDVFTSEPMYGGNDQIRDAIRVGLAAALPKLDEWEYAVRIVLHGEAGEIRAQDLAHAETIAAAAREDGVLIGIVSRTVYRSEWTEVQP